MWKKCLFYNYLEWVFTAEKIFEKNSFRFLKVYLAYQSEKEMEILKAILHSVLYFLEVLKNAIFYQS